MKHSEETIKAAKEYGDPRGHYSETDFLRGVEHAQKDIQELVEALEGANHTIHRLIAGKPVRNLDENLAWYDKLIQKHRR